MSWKRTRVTDKICNTKRRHNNFTYEDILKYAPDIFPTDVVRILHDEGYCSDNYNHDPSYTLLVTRERDATDEEQQKFIDFMVDLRAKDKFQRYEHFLKLKGEFDGQPKPDEPLWNDDELEKRKSNK